MPISLSGDLPSLPPSARAFTLDQVCEALQLSRPSVVGLIEAGRLDAIKVGRTWRISALSLTRLLGESAGEVER